MRKSHICHRLLQIFPQPLTNSRSLWLTVPMSRELSPIALHPETSWPGFGRDMRSQICQCASLAAAKAADARVIASESDISLPEADATACAIAGRCPSADCGTSSFVDIMKECPCIFMRNNCCSHHQQKGMRDLANNPFFKLKLISGQTTPGLIMNRLFHAYSGIGVFSATVIGLSNVYVGAMDLHENSIAWPLAVPAGLMTCAGKGILYGSLWPITAAYVGIYYRSRNAYRLSSVFVPFATLYEPHRRSRLLTHLPPFTNFASHSRGRVRQT